MERESYMEPEAIKFGGTYRVRQPDLLGIPDCNVKVVERRWGGFFVVILPNNKRETVHCTDLVSA
jgi:hypothetical protein